jgi:hypothetical protein
MRTPWGRAQDTQEIAPGVLLVSTAGHGGFKLDRARNAKVPAPCRRRGGFYEEDCEAHIVLAVHQDVQRACLISPSRTAESLAYWLPDAYVTLRDAGFVTPTAESESRLSKNS